jgi:hypothetical protein
MSEFNTTNQLENFTIKISGGSLLTGASNYTIIISMDSVSICSKYYPSNPKINFSNRYQFELSNDQKEKIRQVIVENNFFSLNNNYINQNVKDGFYIDITISKQDKSHTVRIQNYRQLNVMYIIETINTCLPIEFQLKL